MIKKIIFFAFVMFGSMAMVAQTTITGTVKDAATGETLLGANIKVSGKAVGTTTDFDGKFSLTVNQEPPFTLEISILGFQTATVEITQKTQEITVELKENATALDEVVVSASRTPERILESPVTVERLDARAIKNSTSASFYDGLENLKGVDINTNSLTFKSVNTRGFATFANTRFMQLVDGMDNSSPALNFAIGNLLGMSELDVNTVEILPGASSALYGANAFNGIMFMTSRSPFDDQGISFSHKRGLTIQEAAGDNEFFEYNLRMAHVFSEYFALKANLSFLDGVEWFATDDRNTLNGQYVAGDRNSDINYDGLNVYGDEVSTNINGVAQALVGLGVLPAGAEALVPSVNVSRTGYNERDLMTYNARSVKFSAAAHYRPFGDDRLELIWNSKIGRGNTIYQGLNRYNITNFFLEQHKLEVRGKNFFVRGYLTSEDAGDSYDTRFAAININRRWKDDNTWFGEYVGAFVQGTLGGLLPDQAHALARQTADTGRFVPGTEAFQNALDAVSQDPDLATGARFQDNTKLYHVDVNYNFRDLIDWAEFQLGGSFRRYSLNSNGTIFTDFDGPINYDEYGIYTQMQKSFLEEDRLKLTASIRWDGAQNFDSNYSPRVSLAYAAGENKEHNFRASFQTGFRYPTTQDQYIGLDAGRALLVGSAPDNLDRFVSLPFTVSGGGQVFTGTSTIQLTGRSAYENAFSAVSVANGAPQAVTTDLVAPEKVTAFEVGYRGILDVEDRKVSVDLSAYYNTYEDFISNRNVLVPFYGQAGDGTLSLLALANGDFRAFSTYTNSAADVNSYGAAIAINTKIFNDINIGLNYTYAKFEFDEASDPDFEPSFNTPEHKVKLQIGKQELFKNFGFNINLRWQDEYLWQSTFHDALIEQRTILDAQINYSVPEWKSVFKVGGSNLTGQEYFSAPGVGAIGTQVYVSWSINN
jgi:outer membrane receptor for ferrienterochelin and colicin